MGEPATLWLLREGRPAALARLGNAAFDRVKAHKALVALLRPPAAKPAPPVPPTNAVPPTTAQAAPTSHSGIGFDMQPPGGDASAHSFRGRTLPYGLAELSDPQAFRIVQPVRTAEPEVAPQAQESAPLPESLTVTPPLEPAQTDARDKMQDFPVKAQTPTPVIQSEPAVLRAASAPPRPSRETLAKAMGITVKRAAPLAMPRDTPLWADIAPQVETMLDTLPQAQPFAAAVDSARFAALPLEGAAQCYVGSVVVGGVKVLLQAVPSRPMGRPAGFDHTLTSRDGESFWVRYEIES
jgi:hypothetical protein